MRVLIVGSNGYIGSNLVNYLSANKFEVIAGSRRDNSNDGRANISRNFHMDLNDPTTYRDFLNKCDSIIYLVGPGALIRDQSAGKLIQEHLINFARFIDENKKLRNSPIIFSSSGGTIYGRGNGSPFKELDPLEPINPYGLLKLMSEQLLIYSHRNNGTNYISMRISNPYGGIGHKKIDQGVINIFVKKSLAGEPISIWGDGSSVRDYIYMPDLMSAFRACIESIRFSGPINIGGGKGSSLLDICDLIEEYSGSSLTKIFKPSNPLLIDYSVLDISKAMNLIGWNPVYDLKEGVVDFMNQAECL